MRLDANKYKQLCLQTWKDPIYFCALGFGSGLIPVAPGTFGTLAAIPLYLLMNTQSSINYLLIIIMAFIFGVWICHKVSQDLGIQDYSGIVWDEIVGYLLTMFHVPCNIKFMILGFLLFRLFDIWKPQPIRYIEQHVPGGLGVMLDDIIAALMTWMIMQLIIWIFGL